MGYINRYNLKNTFKGIISITLLVMISLAVLSAVPIVLAVAATVALVGGGIWGLKKVITYLKNNMYKIKNNVNSTINTFSATNNSIIIDEIEIDDSPNGIVVDAEYKEVK